MLTKPKTSTEYAEPTVSAIYKMLPLQNQEPVIAYPCRHIGCPKKWLWRTPRSSRCPEPAPKSPNLLNNQGTTMAPPRTHRTSHP